MKKIITSAALVWMSLSSAHAQQPSLSDYYLATVEAASQDTAKQQPVTGVWLTQSGSLEVEIASCGQALCGKVSKVLETPPAGSASPATPILGKTILDGFTSDKGAAWSGKIFSRANGETYSCQMRLISPTELEVTPYKDKLEDGKAQVWTRVSSAATANHS